MKNATEITGGRIELIDALRGIALLGIVIAHMGQWYLAAAVPNFVFEAHQNIWASIFTTLSDIFISGKFYAFFSFLFGMSFYLQIESLSQKSKSPLLIFAWRLVLMGIIGLVHHIFWRGDILSIYAPLGFLLIPARFLSDRWLWILGLVFAMALPPKVIQAVEYLMPKKEMVQAPPPANTNANTENPWEKEAKEYYAIVMGSSWKALFIDNWQHLGAKFQFQVESGRIYVTYGFFLLGTLAGRKGRLANARAYKKDIISTFKKGGLTMLACFVAGISIIGANALFKLNWENNPVVGWIFGFINDGFNATLVVTYICGFSILLAITRRNKVVSGFAAIGKTALSSYLLQTLFGLGLFYGVGLGWFGKTNPALNWGLALVVFWLQVKASQFWLKYYLYGPVEWLWRSATFFRFFPFRRPPAEA